MHLWKLQDSPPSSSWSGPHAFSMHRLTRFSDPHHTRYLMMDQHKSRTSIRLPQHGIRPSPKVSRGKQPGDRQLGVATRDRNRRNQSIDRSASVGNPFDSLMSLSNDRRKNLAPRNDASGGSVKYSYHKPSICSTVGFLHRDHSARLTKASAVNVIVPDRTVEGTDLKAGRGVANKVPKVGQINDLVLVLIFSLNSAPNTRPGTASWRFPSRRSLLPTKKLPNTNNRDFLFVQGFGDARGGQDRLPVITRTNETLGIVHVQQP